MTALRNQPVPVMGYLANNWVNVNDKTPAVIVNPEATTHDLLAWSWGELESLRSLCYVLSEGRETIEIGDLSAIFLQRICPLCDVFNIAASAVINNCTAHPVRAELQRVVAASSELESPDALTSPMRPIHKRGA